MKNTLLFLSILLCTISCKQEPSSSNASETVSAETTTDKKEYEDIAFITPDSIKIFGQLYEVDKSKDIILLFHQGGSNIRGEYGPILSKILDFGLNVLAIDQRLGGQIYGNYNRTIYNIPTHSFNNNYGYCDAYNNLEGALELSQELGFTGKKILWGSSYSASLAIQLADNRPEDVGAVLSFSPASGRVMEGCNPDQHYPTVKVPLLVLRPPSEVESERSKADMALAESSGHQTFVPEYGVHGSSMLVESRVRHDVSKTWEVVTEFINKVKTK